jgi:hypothetical protein
MKAEAIAWELWEAACRISDEEEDFCCRAIKDNATEDFFCSLFEPDYLLEDVIFAGVDEDVRLVVAWMRYVNESDEEARDGRYLALMLAREAVLNPIKWD